MSEEGWMKIEDIPHPCGWGGSYGRVSGYLTRAQWDAYRRRCEEGMGASHKERMRLLGIDVEQAREA